MNVEIVPPNPRPEPKAGQLWRKIAGPFKGCVYLCIERETKLVLYNTDHFTHMWASDSPFSYAEHEFEYVGELKVTP